MYLAAWVTLRPLANPKSRASRRGQRARTSSCPENAMKHTVKSGCRPTILCRARAYRPQLEALEARLPLGDVLLGALLGSSLLGSSLSLREAESAESGSVRSDGAGRRWHEL